MKPRSNNNVHTAATKHRSLLNGLVSLGCEPQLELGFGSMTLAADADGQPVSGRPRRLSRAQWWFERMRQIVDRACDWQPVPPPPPEQIWFANTYRQPAVASASATAQRQICE